MRLDCGPYSASRSVLALMIEPDIFDADARQGSPDKVENPLIEKRRACWKDVRVAISGQKAARDEAVELDWVELPEHLEHLIRDSDDAEERKRGLRSAQWFVKRAEFPEIVSFAIDKSVGRILRKPSEIVGLVENGTARAPQNLTMKDLDRADENGRSFEDLQEFLLREKFTTRFTAAYVYTMKDPLSAPLENAFIPKVRIYTAENICDYQHHNGVLHYVLFRERITNSSNKFDRHKSGNSEIIYRELELVDDAQNRKRVVERVWRKGKDGKYQVSEADQNLVLLSDKSLTAIPVVIDGGIKPEKPIYQALVEKCKEYFRKSAQLEYRYYRVSGSWLWINKKDSSGGLMRRAIDIFRSATGGANKFAKGVGTGGAAATAKMQKPGDGSNRITNKLIPGLGILPTENCDVEWLVDKGSGIDHLVKALERCEKHMSSLGAHFGIDYNFSNISESTFMMQQSGESAHIVSHIMSTSTALTKIAQWIAVFKGVRDEAKLREISVSMNTQLVDEKEAFTFADIKSLYEAQLVTAEEARKMVSKLAPNCIDQDISAQEFLQKIAEESGGGFTPADDITDEDGVPITAENLDMQGVSLNGAQITSLVNLLEQAARDNLPEETVIEVVIRSFQGFDRAAVQKMLAPLRGFTPADQAAENAANEAE